ncbi:hypothetical protein PLESTB_000365000 [Pleodorina starrii]|uniref:Metallo-beta-lactamase domain-containing protein n=1 Tax=Pleodorina starrii TaxID=330485 RepID=A0A9W6EZ72_9CHLO|nr:hypothetical protein PLESTM_000030100 [Pleodorina starrii]GLC50309.1 hypothetical protein PLESTB_000365000 [Pleodorina starrii]GLC64307.1 hypothetical protein PLESTF_000147600 [Pleodorina starrii]
MGNYLTSSVGVEDSGTGAVPGADGTGEESTDKSSDKGSQNFEIVVLGTGAGTTYVYSRETSSSFVVLKEGEPLLLCDAGYGVTASCQHHVGRLPPHIYISHNHGDHAGELPVVLAVESKAAAAAGRPAPSLYAHPDVVEELRQHRLRELNSTGKPLEAFASFRQVPSGGRTPIGDSGLSVKPFLSRHSETCYGLLLYLDDRPLLGWTADSGFDEALYDHLSEAPQLLVDARSEGTEEHAGFNELDRLAALPYMRDKTVYITGYGKQDEAPSPQEVPAGMVTARPGMRIRLAPQQVPAGSGQQG